MNKLAFVSVVLLAGCGDDDATGGTPTPAGTDISGVYVVTAHTENTLACDTEGTARTEPTHFAVRPGSQVGYYAVACASATDCPTDLAQAAFDGNFIANLDTVETDGWSSELTVSADIGVDCTLSFSTSRATVADDGSLTLELWTYEDHVPSGDAACSPTEALARGTAMDCQSRERIVGAPL